MLAVQAEDFAVYMSFADKLIDRLPIAADGVRLRSLRPPPLTE